jgi:hypothetical protein
LTAEAIQSLELASLIFVRSVTTRRFRRYHP